MLVCSPDGKATQKLILKHNLVQYILFFFSYKHEYKHYDENRNHITKIKLDKSNERCRENLSNITKYIVI